MLSNQKVRNFLIRHCESGAAKVAQESWKRTKDWAGSLFLKGPFSVGFFTVRKRLPKLRLIM